MGSEHPRVRTGVGVSLLFVGLLSAWAGTGLHGFGRQWDGIYIDLYVEVLGVPNTLLGRAGVFLSGIVLLLLGAGVFPGEANPEDEGRDSESESET
jgi:hypothetical protein